MKRQGLPATSSGGEIARTAIAVQVNSYVGNGLHQDIHVANHGVAEANVTLSWELAADFADEAEVQRGSRQQTAPIVPVWTNRKEGGELEFRYLHPKLAHRTILRFSGPGAFVEGLGMVSCTVALAPQQTQNLAIDIVPVFLGETIEPFYATDGEPRDDAPEQVRRAWKEGCATLDAAEPRVQAAWDRAAADLGSLHLLDGEGEERFTPAAGIPNYTGLFGRDALVASWQSALLNPATLRGTLRLVGRWNARDYDDRFDAEPGKVLHQRQLSPLALLGHQPFLHYYGDYSASGLFLLGLALDLAYSGDTDFFRSMRDKALATLEWMDRDGDADGDGLYEYQTKAGDQGIKNQGWKDSDEGILYEDGRMVPNPIAVAEIQGLYYAAKHAIAVAFAAVGEHARCDDLLQQAASLKRRFNERFWVPEDKFFGLALDPQKRLVRSLASNPGACLGYGIVDADKAEAVVERLMAPDMFTGWGIRTLSSRHPAYNPSAYHLGTVWPFENALIGFGMKRYGFTDSLHRLARALFDATELFHLDRLPEVFGGHPRDRRHPHPGIYPGACAPQAWSASAIVSLVNTMLGLIPLAPLKTIIVDPDLPEWLPELTMHNIRVGGARVSLRFHRDGSGRTECATIEQSGNLHIHRPAQPIVSEDQLTTAVQGAISGLP